MSAYWKSNLNAYASMPTVVPRFEQNKKRADIGTIYYRIYKGHNRRMEFSSRIRVPISSWDETTKTIKGNNYEACHARAQIEADLMLLKQIIVDDVAGSLSMGDMITIFKQRRMEQKVSSKTRHSHE